MIYNNIEKKIDDIYYEKKQKDRKIRESFPRNKAAVEHESDGDTNCSRYGWNPPQRFRKETGGTGNQKKNQDHTNQSIVKIG